MCISGGAACAGLQHANLPTCVGQQKTGTRTARGTLHQGQCRRCARCAAVRRAVQDDHVGNPRSWSRTGDDAEPSNRQSPLDKRASDDAWKPDVHLLGIGCPGSQKQRWPLPRWAVPVLPHHTVPSGSLRHRKARAVPPTSGLPSDETQLIVAIQRDDLEQWHLGRIRQGAQLCSGRWSPLNRCMPTLLGKGQHLRFDQLRTVDPALVQTMNLFPKRCAVNLPALLGWPGGQVQLQHRMVAARPGHHIPPAVQCRSTADTVSSLMAPSPLMVDRVQRSLSCRCCHTRQCQRWAVSVSEALSSSGRTRWASKRCPVCTIMGGPVLSCSPSVYWPIRRGDAEVSDGQMRPLQRADQSRRSLFI